MGGGFAGSGQYLLLEGVILESFNGCFASGCFTGAQRQAEMKKPTRKFQVKMEAAKALFYGF